MFAVYIILGIVTIAFILGIIGYNYYKIKRDVSIYKKNYQEVIASSGATVTGDDGTDGAAGKSALEQYNESIFPSPPVNQATFESLYVGSSGSAGAPAPGPGIDGDHGKDGSEGDVGDIGDIGDKGASGENGINGISGESFLSVYVSDTPANDVTQLTSNVDPYDATSPTDYLYCEFIYNKATDNPPRLAYYYNGSLLFHLSINNATPAGTNPDIYISYIVYDNNTVIGLTSPIKISDYESSNDITTTIVLGSNPNVKLRAILSRNKGLVMSSFTQDIYEANIDDQEFVYQRPAETDPFINNLYTIIGNTYGTDNIERVKISAKNDTLSLITNLG